MMPPTDPNACVYPSTPLALLRIAEELCEPCRRGDEFHAHADERGAPQDEEPVDIRGEPGAGR
jgi:hypothetical protein